MPDITALPLLAEIFGVQIDDLFDLTNEQRLNRIENRLDMEEDLPQDVFLEYEEFLKTELGNEKHQKRATELIAYLYWHKMDAYARKVRRYARDAIRLSPGEKNCQWMLIKADGHARWDWNLRNHSGAIDFYREMVKEAPEEILPYEYLLDNLIADHRADEAEEVLERLSRLEASKPVVNEVYRAHIALARFDEKTADSIMAELLRQHPEDSDCLFESAQYYLLKCDYEKAIDLYEKSFAFSKRQPRFIDELQSIAQIHEIRGEYRKAADTCDRIIDLLKNEWHMTEEVELRNVEEEKKRLLGKV